jgi:predicted RNA-binding protein with TRAM domain
MSIQHRRTNFTIFGFGKHSVKGYVVFNPNILVGELPNFTIVQNDCVHRIGFVSILGD